MTLLRACLAALLGVGLGLVWAPTPEGLVAAGLGAIIGSIVMARAGGRKASRWLLLGAVMAAAAARGAHERASLHSPNAYNDSGTYQLVCRVESDPRLRGLWQAYTCTVRTVDGKAVSPWSMAVTARPLVGLQFGDTVRLEGEPTTPAAGDDGGYREYLARRGVTSVLMAEDAQLVAPGEWSPRRWLYGVRRRALSGLLEAVPEPEASFLSGIVLGTSEGLPRSVEEDLRRSGLLHILVVSGANVSLLAALLVESLRRPLGWGAAFTAALGFCLAYVVLTGGDPPVVRGAVMVLLAVGARAAGRPGHGWTSLALAAAGMAVLSPRLLLEPSYQLSVTTSAGMLWVQGLNWRPGVGRRWLATASAALLTTVAAQIASLPVQAAHFGRLPGLGLLSNALVLPLQAAQMVSALVAAGAAMVSPAAAAVVAVPAWALARLTLTVARWAAAVPLASIQCEPWRPVAALAYLTALAIVVSGRWRAVLQWLRGSGAWRRLRRVPAWAGGLALTVLVWGVALQLPDGRLHVRFLDVGQGDAILLTTPSGRTVLVDGGPDPDVLRTHLGRALPFWQRHLDVVVLTHPDLDHMGGLLGLDPRYSPDLLLNPAAPVPEAWSTKWAELGSRAREEVTAAAGQTLDLGDGVELQVLYPPPSGCPTWASSDNDCSTVLRVTYGSASLLLTGDAEGLVERLLIAQGAIQPTWVLKVSHHGAGRATTGELLDPLRPRMALISVGDNRYGHPSAEVLRRLSDRQIQCLRTDQLGTIEVQTDGRSYSVHHR